MRTGPSAHLVVGDDLIDALLALVVVRVEQGVSAEAATDERELPERQSRSRRGQAHLPSQIDRVLRPCASEHVAAPIRDVPVLSPCALPDECVCELSPARSTRPFLNVAAVHWPMPYYSCQGLRQAARTYEGVPIHLDEVELERRDGLLRLLLGDLFGHAVDAVLLLQLGVEDVCLVRQVEQR